MAADLSIYDSDYQPADKTGPSDKAFSLLKDRHNYDAECVYSTYGPASDNKPNMHIWKTRWQIIAPGDDQLNEKVVEKTHFVDFEQPREKVKEALGRIGRDLLTLGFDSDVWPDPAIKRPFSQEFPKAVKHMIGVRAELHYRYNKPHHNLYFNKRLPDDRPEKFSADELNAEPPLSPDEMFGDGTPVPE